MPYYAITIYEYDTQTGKETAVAVADRSAENTMEAIEQQLLEEFPSADDAYPIASINDGINNDHYLGGSIWSVAYCFEPMRVDRFFAVCERIDNE